MGVFRHPVEPEGEMVDGFGVSKRVKLRSIGAGMLRWLATDIATVCLMCGLCCGQQTVYDPATYASFFEQVARLKSGGPVLLNGQDTGLILPSVQQTIGLTDDETAILQNLAVTCATKSRSFDEAARSGTFELRLQLIGS